MSKSVYMCLNVRGALNDLSRSKQKISYFTDSATGKPISRIDAIDGLCDELTKGHEVIPMHSKCGNPCQNSDKCAGFDYGKDGGCPGYEVEDAA